MNPIIWAPGHLFNVFPKKKKIKEEKSQKVGFWNGVIKERRRQKDGKQTAPKAERLPLEWVVAWYSTREGIPCGAL